MPTVSPCTTMVSPAKPIPLTQLRLRIHRRLLHPSLTTSQDKYENSTCNKSAGGEVGVCRPWLSGKCCLQRLLEQHYGLTLNDTPFSDETVIQQHIDAGISLADAVNFLVEKYGLVRIDRRIRLARTVPISAGGSRDILRGATGNWFIERNRISAAR